MEISPGAAWIRRPSLYENSSCHTEVAPWTAAKCHRLLRPIQLRIRALQASSDPAETKLSMESRSLQPSLTSTKRRAAEIKDSKIEPNPKKARVTYSQRKRRPVRSTSPRSLPSSTDSTPPPRTQCLSRRPKSPGSLLIPTSIIRKIRSPQESPCRRVSTAQTKANGAFDEYLAKELRSLIKSRLPPGRLEPNRGLLQALGSLFRHAAVKGPRGGRKSLMAMCIRRAPVLVEQLEKLEEEETERSGEKSTLDTPNVSFEMYSELEGFPGLGRGCQLLAEMVRSHAVVIVREAIEAGYIPLQVSMAMVTLASHWQFFEEAAGLLEAMLTYHLGCGRHNVAVEGCEAAHLLLFVGEFCNRHKQWNMVFEILARVLQDGRISEDWLLRKDFLPLWRALARSLATEVRCPGATVLSTTSLAALSNPVKKVQLSSGTSEFRDAQPPDQVLTRVLSALTAIGYLTEEPSKRSRALSILEQTLAVWWKRGSLAKNTSAHLLAIGTVIASKGASLTGLKLLKASQAGDKQYHAIVSLVSGVARLCGRDSTQPSHDFLAAMCDTIAGIKLAGRSTADITMDAAFLLAQKTCDLRDLTFAESLPTSRDASHVHESVGGKTWSSSDTLFSGYRWDEGISEWVLRTPAVNAASKSKLSNNHAVVQASHSPCMKTRARLSQLDRETKDEDCSDKRKLPPFVEIAPPSRRARNRRRQPLISLQANMRTPTRDPAGPRKGKGGASKVVRPSHQHQRRVIWDVELSSEDELW